MLPIVVFISGNGTNLQAIIDKCHGTTVDIRCVISDNPDAYGLKRAVDADIPIRMVPQTPDRNREQYCEDLYHITRAFGPDLIVLAGFMKILTPEFVRGFTDKIINIHPSLLPRYAGLNTHQRVFKSDDTEHGITIHIVDEGMDTGPILLQKKFDIMRKDTIHDLETKCHALEYKWYPEVVNLLARWKLFGDK